MGKGKWELLPTDPHTAKQVLDAEAQQQVRETGALGRVFGSKENAPHNIVATVVILLIVFGILYSVLPVDKSTFSAKEAWTIITPIITLALGYLFGTPKGPPPK